MEEETRRKLHILLDQMIDECKEIGNVAYMTPLVNDSFKVNDLRLILKNREYTI